jgi:hypothetical protein
MARPRKRLLDPQRVRRIREGFSWIDRRFLREGWIEKLEREEILLYFFLVAVADKEGLSYYSDPRVCSLLKIAPPALARARARLEDLGLLAYERPLYQVLSLDAPPPRPEEGAIPLREVFRRIVERRPEP